MNELDVADIRRQQEVGLRYNALITAIDIAKTGDGGTLLIDSILETATKITTWVNGTPEGVVKQ